MKKNISSIRILIAEDHELVRYGLNSILEQHSDLEVIGEALSCSNALTLSATINPDVILLNLTLEDGGSLEYITKIKEKCPQCKILVFTASVDINKQLLSLRYGAVGILLKSSSAAIICKAIRQVHLNDELWIDQTLITAMWKNNIQNQLETNIVPSTLLPSAAASSPNTLTPRENQIACLSSKGLSAKQIGKKLCISEKTVRNQLTLIYNKLGVKNQLGLALHGNFF